MFASSQRPSTTRRRSRLGDDPAPVADPPHDLTLTGGEDDDFNVGRPVVVYGAPTSGDAEDGPVGGCHGAEQRVSRRLAFERQDRDVDALGRLGHMDEDCVPVVGQCSAEGFGEAG